MLNQGFMMLHVVLGVLGILFAVALFMDTLNVNEGHFERTKRSV